MRRKGLVLMKKIIRMPVLLMLAVLLAAAVIPAGAHPVSPALQLLAADAEMAKAGLQFGEIHFTADDFARALNRAKVNSVTVLSLPPEAEGKLMLGTTNVYAGQVIARGSLGLLRFVPAADAVTESAFTFCADGGDYAITVYGKDQKVFAPEVNLGGAKYTDELVPFLNAIKTGEVDRSLDYLIYPVALIDATIRSFTENKEIEIVVPEI
jgi:hypothetical protein